MLPEYPAPPPWEQNEPEFFDTTGSIFAIRDVFLKRKLREVEKDELSLGRYDVLRVSLNDFVTVTAH